MRRRRVAFDVNEQPLDRPSQGTGPLEELAALLKGEEVDLVQARRLCAAAQGQQAELRLKSDRVQASLARIRARSRELEADFTPAPYLQLQIEIWRQSVWVEPDETRGDPRLALDLEGLQDHFQEKVVRGGSSTPKRRRHGEDG